MFLYESQFAKTIICYFNDEMIVESLRRVVAAELYIG